MKFFWFFLDYLKYLGSMYSGYSVFVYIKWNDLGGSWVLCVIGDFMGKYFIECRCLVFEIGYLGYVSFYRKIRFESGGIFRS